MTRKERNAITWVIIGLVLIFAIVAYLISIGRINFISSTNEKNGEEDEPKKSLSERIGLLSHRYDRVQKILTSKRDLKEKLDRVCKNIFLGVRLTLVFIVISIGVLIHTLLNANFKDIVDYIQILGLLICFIGFVCFGNPINIISIWSYLTKKLTLYVYGRYINLDLEIKAHDNELEKIYIEKKEAQKELADIIEIEREIHEVLSKPN